MAEFLLPDDTNGENNESHGINNGNGDDPSKQKHDMKEEVNDVIGGRFHDKDMEKISEDILRAEMENTENKGYEKDVEKRQEAAHVDENDMNKDAADAISKTEIITQDRRQQELYNGQEVYLMKFGKRIFNAT